VFLSCFLVWFRRFGLQSIFFFLIEGSCFEFFNLDKDVSKLK
jgi:hypothetical protein